MRITEEFLNGMEKNDNFSDGVILPDGEYVLLEKGGHLEALMAQLPYPEKEIWKMIPDDDSALFWLIEETGCVITDYNSTVGMTMTDAQKEVFDLLVSHGIITEQYCNLTRQRQMVRERREQQIN